MPMCAIELSGEAPCQCFTPGGIQTTSPGLISSTGSPQRCTRPLPDETIKTWPSGWLCHAVRAPGSNVTKEPDVRDDTFVWNKRSTRTEPVKFSAGPCREGCEPLRVILIDCESGDPTKPRRELSPALLVWVQPAASS